MVSANPSAGYEQSRVAASWGRELADRETTADLHVCVIDSAEVGTAYPRLAECPVDVMALVPHVEQVNLGLLAQYDAVLVGCGPNELEDSTFQSQVTRIVRVAPAIAIVSDGANPATAARIGFHGFVSRAVEPLALARTIRAVSQGEIAFPRSALTGLFQLLSFLPLGNPDGDAPVALTPRQRQIVDLIAQGATDREIATRLRISESTAHKHVQNALRRSKTRTRSQLVAVARQGASS
jgi:DNA-binding NarL/FixJ family response regulator